MLDNLYVRSGMVPTGQDIRMFDLCKFQIATNGLQGTNVNVGELWVTYQVAMIKPKLYAALGLYETFGRFQSLSWSNLNPIRGRSVTAWTASADSNLDVMDIIPAVDNQILMPKTSVKQAYSVMINWIGTAASVAYPTITANNCTVSVKHRQV